MNPNIIKPDSPFLALAFDICRDYANALVPLGTDAERGNFSDCVECGELVPQGPMRCYPHGLVCEGCHDKIKGQFNATEQ